jgi:acetyl-CoA decarbonylase/synthase complex subunit delta
LKVYDKKRAMEILKELAESLSSLDLDEDEIVLEGVEIEAEEMEFEVVRQALAEMKAPEVLGGALEIPRFEPRLKEWPNQIQEVPMGATRADGGTRGKVVKLGGERYMPFSPEGENPNSPVVTFDTFDSKIPLPSTISKHYKDVMGHPGEWAKRSVEKYGARMVTIHLTSTDPKGHNTSPREAARSVEEVLQAVDVPLVIGGSGNPGKDPEVLAAAAEAAEGERCLLASATLDTDWKRIADAAIKYNHNILAWTTIDINLQKELNRKLLGYGVDRDRIVMDPTTAALGYGIEYSISVIQRIRLAGLGGDKELDFPISNGVTNAWGAREAWMSSKTPMEKYGEDWGSREYRGPLWEVFTGLSMLLAGSDLLMELHPRAVVVLKEMVDRMSGQRKGQGPAVNGLRLDA